MVTLEKEFGIPTVGFVSESFQHDYWAAARSYGIIDLPQAVDAAGNKNAPMIMERDVANLRNYFGRYAPELLATDYGREIWKLYATGELTPTSPLSGRFQQCAIPADVRGVLRDVDSARRWHELNGP